MSSLTGFLELELSSCPIGMERCQGESGEDWHKIAHVRNIICGGLVQARELQEVDNFCSSKLLSISVF